MNIIEKDNKKYKQYSCDYNKINYSQRNNEYKFKDEGVVVNASTTCNVTAMCMALDYLGYNFPTGKYKQPEDNLADFIMNSKEVDDHFKKIMPVEYAQYKAKKPNCYTPNEIHDCLSLGTNLWIQKQVTKFSTDVDFKKALYDNLVMNHKPIVISGAFPKKNGVKLHHIVCVTGVCYNENEKVSPTTTPSFIKVDDPYGNTLNDWVGTGNDVYLSWEYIVKNLKPIGSQKYKWCHLFEEQQAIV